MGRNVAKFLWYGGEVRVESRDEPVEGHVDGLGEILYYDGVIVGPINNSMGIDEEWAVALVPGKGAFCACDRCRGEYHGPDSNLYGSYGYGGCLSVLDNPNGEDVSTRLLDDVYSVWAEANPDLCAEADLGALRTLIREFLDRKVGFAELRREAAKWGAL